MWMHVPAAVSGRAASHHGVMRAVRVTTTAAATRRWFALSTRSLSEHASARSASEGTASASAARAETTVPDSAAKTLAPRLPPALPELQRHHRAPLLPERAPTERITQFRVAMLRGHLEEAWHLYTLLERTQRIGELVAEDHSRLLRAICSTVENEVVQSGFFALKATRREDSASPAAQAARTRVLHVMAQMRMHGHRPNMRDYTAALRVLGRLGNAREVERVWQQMMPTIVGHRGSLASTKVRPSLHAYNARLEAHVRVRQVGECYRIVREMHQNGPEPDSMTYDLLAELHGLVGNPEGAVHLLHERLKKNGYTGYDALLLKDHASSAPQPDSGDGKEAPPRRTNKRAKSNLSETPPPPTTHSFNAVIRAYKRANNAESATRIYRLLTESVRPPAHLPELRPNIATYNELMGAQYQADFELHLGLLERLRKRDSLEPNAYTYHLLIKYACCERSQWSHAERLWHEMRSAGIQPLGRTCQTVIRRLKRPRFDALRQEAYELSTTHSDASGTSQLVY
ncbi:hypothetical protein THASP1DRAFT_32166 [Thamnocephalis sphaerospora]|uniref:Pentacotripeptide-repeat region of PRORP domain-containing protein n=1 Tax=Thamnocephalis sphaerospora TaxID=78915 RepID=A0A4P9XJQ6_9FUNG|nr:hypothetical protein THASP1DRAFT_32166 [Thamnocephalis sphaerospora]|eukprot:RKP06004.1 hypothetical protein THASP1DRAFT_32166 [Thamnocephalis sphaerospora]